MIPIDNDFEAQFTLESKATPIPEDAPFHILFMGDYSGRENQSQTEKSLSLNYNLIEIDRDNFNDVLDSLNVCLHIDLQGNGQDYLLLNFYELDDFHPDRIFQQIPLFSDLRKKRNELLNTDTFEIAAKEVRSWINNQQQHIDILPANSEPSTISSGNLLDDILGDTKVNSDSYDNSTSSFADLDSFIRNVVKPHIVYTDESEQARLIAFVDEAISELMRKILHHKDFQALESAWRGLYFVARTAETNNKLKLFLMDINKDELAINLKNVNSLEDSVLYQNIVHSSSKSKMIEPWAIICGDYEFELNVEDTATLIRMANVGESQIASFITHIQPHILGVDSVTQIPSSLDWKVIDDTNATKLWNLLRTIPEAQNLGFALPKFLTRLPYGSQTEPTEAFAFEEFTEAFQHDNYVWANSSYICALLLAQSYSSYAWDFQNRLFTEIDGLPTHIYSIDGETQTKPCAEINMTHNACELLLEHGFLPLISFRNTDTIKLADLNSVALPAKNLKGRWK